MKRGMEREFSLLPHPPIFWVSCNRLATLFVCVCVTKFFCVCVYVYMCMCVVCVQVCSFVYVCMCIYVCVFVCVCVHVCVSVHVFFISLLAHPCLAVGCDVTLYLCV